MSKPSHIFYGFASSSKTKAMQAVMEEHWKRREAEEWRQTLASLCAFNSQHLPQPKTLIVDNIKGTSPQKLLGHKHGVVFTPNAVLELLDILRS